MDSQQKEASTNDLLIDVINRLEKLEAGGNHGNNKAGGGSRAPHPAG